MTETPTHSTKPEDSRPNRPRLARVGRPTGKAAKAGWAIYQHIAAVFATFGIAAFIGQFWDIGWRGFLQTIVGVWELTIRPAMTWVFHYVVTVPASWIEITVVVPEVARDYLSVGLIMALSFTRESRKAVSESRNGAAGPGIRDWIGSVMSPRRVTSVKVYPHDGDAFMKFIPRQLVDNWPPGIILMWPAALAFWVRRVLLTLIRRRARQRQRNLRGMNVVTLRPAFVLAPLLYLALLLAMNTWVMPHIP